MSKKRNKINRFKGLRCFFIGPFLFSLLFSGHPISIDGLYQDWEDVPIAYIDTEDDDLGADYSTLKITCILEGCNLPSNVGCVLQPTFLPWAGFFDLMDQCDVVVWLDDVGFSKQSWQQRNRLRGPDGLEYLSVPVKTAGKLGQNIYSVEVADDSFSDSALRRISELYESSSHYSEFFPKLVVAFEEGSRSKLLAELNVRLIDFLHF